MEVNELLIVEHYSTPKGLIDRIGTQSTKRDPAKMGEGRGGLPLGSNSSEDAWITKRKQRTGKQSKTSIILKMNNRQNQKEGNTFNSKEINLFPTQIWIFPPDEEMAEAIKRIERQALDLRQSRPELATPMLSGRGIWRMPSPHLVPEFKPATERIERMLSATCKRLGLPAGRRKFDTWLNVNDPGSYHVQHQHSPNLLSGVLYLSDIQGSGRIILKDPRAARLCCRETQGGPIEVPVSTTAGGAAIFPSWLEHYVEENQATHPTACIAFNLGGLIGEH